MRELAGLCWDGRRKGGAEVNQDMDDDGESEER